VTGNLIRDVIFLSFPDTYIHACIAKCCYCLVEKRGFFCYNIVGKVWLKVYGSS
jgi:hypothetical protein